MEKGWSTKFKLAKALEEKPTLPLYRPVSPETRKAYGSPALSKQGKLEMLPKSKLAQDLNVKEKIEFRSLKRRFGN